MVFDLSEAGDGEFRYFAAIGVSLLAAVSWSVGSLLSRKMDLPHNPFMTAALQMTLGGLALILFGVMTGESYGFSFARVTLSASLAVLYLLVFGSLVAFTAFVWLIKNVSPSRVATYAFVNPIVAVLLGTFVAGEAISLQAGFAGILLVTSVILIIRLNRPVFPVRAIRLRKHIQNRRTELKVALNTDDIYSGLRNRHRGAAISRAHHKTQSQ